MTGMKHRPEMVRIKEVIGETNTVKTFIVDKKLMAEPGQFCMLWIPGVGEKPFSFSYIEKFAGVTVRRAGRFTESMHKLDAHDTIGLRGPYGNGFRLAGKDVIVVAGGCGAAPLLPLVKRLGKRDITIIVGASTESELLFVKEYEEHGEVLTVTDDGSSGTKGTTVDILGNVLVLKKPDQIYACGPERMLSSIMEIALKNRIPCQLSLERYMKCGMGLCGSCLLDGMRVCEDGPIFEAIALKDTEFGKSTRDASGSRMRV
ncbi:MAG: dihydroorotate dehydrogenase electron transfer subunit [Candidatus Altiarchaeota archaeon]